MPRLTDTQLVILSAASRRDDRGVELPANHKDEAARKAVAQLIRAGLLEEVRAAGSLPIWRRDDESGPMALRITKQGLEAIDVEDEVTGPAETSGRPDPDLTVSLAFLDPALVKAAIDGRLSHGMGVTRLADLPAEWSRQRRILGLPPR